MDNDLASYWNIFYGNDNADRYDEDLFNYHKILKTFIDKQNCNDDEAEETDSVKEGYQKVAQWLKDQHDTENNIESINGDESINDEPHIISGNDLNHRHLHYLPEEEPIYAEVIEVEIHNPPEEVNLQDDPAIDLTNEPIDVENEVAALEVIEKNISEELKNLALLEEALEKKDKIIKEEHKIVIHVKNEEN